MIWTLAFKLKKLFDENYPTGLILSYRTSFPESAAEAGSCGAQEGPQLPEEGLRGSGKANKVIV